MKRSKKLYEALAMIRQARRQISHQTFQQGLKLSEADLKKILYNGEAYEALCRMEDRVADLIAEEEEVA